MFYDFSEFFSMRFLTTSTDCEKLKIGSRKCVYNYFYGIPRYIASSRGFLYHFIICFPITFKNVFPNSKRDRTCFICSFFFDTKRNSARKHEDQFINMVVYYVVLSLGIGTGLSGFAAPGLIYRHRTNGVYYIIYYNINF